MLTDTKGILNSIFDPSPLKDQEDIELLSMPKEDIQEPFVNNPFFETDPC